MGIPGFFAWLRRHIDNKILTKGYIKTKYLFIDANGLFHPACLKLADNMKDLHKLESDMIKEIKESIQRVVKMVEASIVYICVDGVAPLAKVKQQRLRRYKSIKEKKFFDELKKKYNKEIKETWTNVAITPGTKFMEKITQELDKWSKEIGYIFLSADIRGEGEHKILQLIRSLSIPINEKIAIHGLDADLIFLMACTKKRNIYLIREQNDGDLTIVNMDYVKRYIDEDFMVMCFLAGNDFLPHLPSIDIYHNGMDYLTSTFNEMRLYNLIKTRNFYYYLEALSRKEQEFFKELYKTMQNKKQNNRIEKSYDYEEYIYRNVMYGDDYIQLGKDHISKYKYRYYEYYCGAFLDQQEIVDKMCYTYLKTIYWIYLYYTKGCPCWRWFYPFDVAPFASDLVDYMKRNHFSFNEIKFKNEKEITKEQQLICVIPKQYKFLIPKQLHSVFNKYSYMFPDDFQEDTHNKTRHYKCMPLLPEFDFERIIKY